MSKKAVSAGQTMGLRQSGANYSPNYNSQGQALQQMKQRPSDERVAQSRRAHIARQNMNSPSVPWSPGGRRNRNG